MKLSKVIYVVFAILIAGFFIVLLGAAMENMQVIYFGFVIMAVAFGFDIVYSRCPHCKEYLRHSTWKHCPHCGKELEDRN